MMAQGVDFKQTMNRILAPIIRRIGLLVSRATIKQVDDTLYCQSVQVSLTADEVQDRVEHFQPYGFTAVPSNDAEGVFLSIGGVRSNGILIVAADRRYRPKNMVSGDVCLHDQAGERVYIENATGIVNIGAKAGAEFIAQATKTLDRLQAIVTAYNAHTHLSAAPGAPTGPPVALLSTPVASVAATKGKVT